jgi:excisionase family DNA binding protein
MAKMLNIDDVAEILGKKANTIRLMIGKKEIPYFFKVGRDWRIMESDFYDWLNELKTRSISDKVAL